MYQWYSAVHYQHSVAHYLHPATEQTWRVADRLGVWSRALQGTAVWTQMWNVESLRRFSTINLRAAHSPFTGVPPVVFSFCSALWWWPPRPFVSVDWRWATELLGHADCFHDDVWPRELLGGRGIGGSAVLDPCLGGLVIGCFNDILLYLCPIWTKQLLGMWWVNFPSRHALRPPTSQTSWYIMVCRSNKKVQRNVTFCLFIFYLNLQPGQLKKKLFKVSFYG